MESKDQGEEEWPDDEINQYEDEDEYNEYAQPVSDQVEQIISKQSLFKDGFAGMTSGLEYSKNKDFVFFTINEVLTKLLPVKITNMKDAYGLNADEAIATMRYFHWNEEKMQDKWFEREQAFRYEIGITPNKKMLEGLSGAQVQEINASKKEHNGGYCTVCYANFADMATDPLSEPCSLACGHQFCIGCWTEYLAERIKQSAKNSLTTKCQQKGCNMVVPYSLFVSIFEAKNPPLMKRYQRYHCQSYTDDNSMVRWCPFRNCDYAANKLDYTDQNIVNCLCGESYCFKCGKESHSPATCKMQTEWSIKNSSESENVNWIIANTKQCPNTKCGKPIEKNQGCNHMQCKMCNAEFCWICLGEWKQHNQSTGGYYKCNRFNDTEVTSQNKTRENAKFELQKYIFYFERFNNHHKSEGLANEMKEVIQSKIALLHELKSYPQIELVFLTNAVNEIARCRHVLKYTYCYGYYQSNMSKQQRNLFEHQQMLLEEACEALHGMIEKPLDPFLDPLLVDRGPFFRFKANLINQTNLTSGNYKTLVDSLEQQYFDAQK